MGSPEDKALDPETSAQVDLGSYLDEDVESEAGVPRVEWHQPLTLYKHVKEC